MLINKPSDHILEVLFDSPRQLCEATYRFSHYYENPEWRGKVFCSSDLNEHYRKAKDDPEWWLDKWAGSNIPDYAFKPFLKGDFEPVSWEEMKILESLVELKKPYYVIMYVKGDWVIRNRELAHAFYYIDADYRATVDSLLDKYTDSHPKEMKKAESVLHEMGYSESVMKDELHVYCGIYYNSYLKQKGCQLPKDLIKSLSREFADVAVSISSKKKEVVSGESGLLPDI